MTDIYQTFQPFYWLQSHEWVFWLLVNTPALFVCWISQYTILGILGIIFPFVSGACTVIFASEWWMESIGIATIIVASLPLFLVKTDP